MQLEVKPITNKSTQTNRFAVMVDGKQGEDFGTKTLAFAHMDLLWDMRSSADKRIEQAYTGR